MVKKPRIVKKIIVPPEVFKGIKVKDRLDTFWNFLILNLKKKRDIRIDVTKIQVGKKLNDYLKYKVCPFTWLDVSPSLNVDLKDFEVAICSGWNTNIRRRTAEERVRHMLTGEDSSLF